MNSNYRQQGAAQWILFTPYWLILLAMAVPWSALLVWRAGRRKRASPNVLRSPSSPG